MSLKKKVIIRRVPGYNPQAIRRVVTEGLEEFGLSRRIQGRITIKPNVVMAHHKVTPCAYTRPEFLEGVAAALRGLEKPDTRITVTEKCGAGIPTSRMFRRAGYREVSRRYGLRLLPIEEAKKKKIPLRNGKIHAKITTAAEIADNDLLIYTPKLKSNALSHGLTGAIKLNIGLLLDRERMWNHNYNLDDKIVDLLEVGMPEFIAADAIEVSLGGNHLTQHAKHKDLVLWFFLKAGVLNPLFRFDLIIDAYVCLFFAWCRRLLTLRF